MKGEESMQRENCKVQNAGETEWIYLNDRFVPRAQAMISVFDHGFLYGDGVFETLRVYRGQIFQMKRHLERLTTSCDLIGLSLPIPKSQWPALLSESLRRNDLSDASLRITISRGEGEIGLDPSLCSRPTVVIMAKPFKPYPADYRQNGVHLALASIRRNPIAAQPPEVKSLSFLNNILAKHEAAQAGCFDALMLNMNGLLTECTTSNVFFVRQGQLCTPSTECGILRGVTRDVVITLAKEEGLSVVEGSFSLEQLLDTEECFLTNTGMEVMPVSQVDGHCIGGSCPGVWTVKLHQLFQANLNRFVDG
ncbi:MAG: branched chain amino acid aminotransferase [Nitrospirales bacterium]|nr:MAG: branched chain amino acid aminotransferase [Nitrospirales bacterium]